MTAIELFIIALVQMDKMVPGPPGPYELVIRNHNIYAQRQADHRETDILVLEYYKHVNRPRMTSVQWQELCDTLELLQEEGAL